MIGHTSVKELILHIREGEPVVRARRKPMVLDDKNK